MADHWWYTVFVLNQPLNTARQWSYATSREDNDSFCVALGHVMWSAGILVKGSGPTWLVYHGNLIAVSFLHNGP